jgi:hypothetical protein
MVNESRTFGVVVLLTLGGLGVMLWGVSLNSGMALNTPIIAGGLVLVVATGVFTAGINSIAEPEADQDA